MEFSSFKTCVYTRRCLKASLLLSAVWAENMPDTLPLESFVCQVVFFRTLCFFGLPLGFWGLLLLQWY